MEAARNHEGEKINFMVLQAVLLIKIDEALVQYRTWIQARNYQLVG